MTAWPFHNGQLLELNVLYGSLELQTLRLQGAGNATFREMRRLHVGDTLNLTISEIGD